MTSPVSPALQRLQSARLYLITPANPKAGPLEEFLPQVLDSGVDMVQLREKDMEARQLLKYCEIVRKATEDSGAIFIVNDRVDVAIAAGADGVHLGQEDLSTFEARRQGGRDFLIGLSTHSPAEVIDSNESEADYIAVGPVFETPTKPGRPAVGLELVKIAATQAAKPFFAIGGIDEKTIAPVVEAGATRVSVLRAITEADDPAAATRRLGARLTEFEK